jgi:hypothetical protein
MDDYTIIPPPYRSWTELNPVTKQWIPPLPYPDDGKAYRWDEPTLAWVEIAQPTT